MDMKTTALALIATIIAISPSVAKYLMPPIGVVLRTAPIIVDAPLPAIDPTTLAVELDIHHNFR